ncbi:hypothetical protein ACJJTC_012210 [Scirpophaga incertulas]
MNITLRVKFVCGLIISGVHRGAISAANLAAENMSWQCWQHCTRRSPTAVIVRAVLLNPSRIVFLFDLNIAGWLKSGRSGLVSDCDNCGMAPLIMYRWEISSKV